MSSSTTTAHTPAAWTARPGAAGRLLPSEALMSLACRAFSTEQRGSVSAIDVGCGSGRNLLGLATVGYRQLTGLDCDRQLLSTAQKNLQQAGIVADCRPGEIVNIPFQDQSFDLTVCWGVIFVLGGKAASQQAMHELARITRPGGCIITDWRTEDDALFGYVGTEIEPGTIVLAEDTPSSLGGMTYSFWDRQVMQQFHEDCRIDDPAPLAA
jgi:ubiquinone/menaquinone biosynthesis C-methylase UbiE